MQDLAGGWGYAHRGERKMKTTCTYECVCVCVCRGDRVKRERDLVWRDRETEASPKCARCPHNLSLTGQLI